MAEFPDSNLDYDLIAGIRMRPAMYIGGTDFFGFIQYIVSACDLLLSKGASWIEVEVSETIRLTSDAQIVVEQDEHGRVSPFETCESSDPRRIPDAAIVSALSDQLTVNVSDAESETIVKYIRGERTRFETIVGSHNTPKVQLLFTPDAEILTVTEVSPAVLLSYCKRMSFLHERVEFRIVTPDGPVRFRTENGIRELFDSIASPYQLLNEPIEIRASEGQLKIDAVIAFHSWNENLIWSFANKGRVPEGGTHEEGLLAALQAFENESHLRHFRGIIAVIAFEHPGVVYEGCIKNRIGNPELKDQVCGLFVEGISRWLNEHTDESRYLLNAEFFQFAEKWERDS